MARRRKKDHLNVYIYCLRVLRILLVFIPQNGYIHPDEYFQSVEVLAGLELKCLMIYRLLTTFVFRTSF